MKRLLLGFLVLASVAYGQDLSRGGRSIHQVFAADAGGRTSGILTNVLNGIGTNRMTAVVLDGGTWTITNNVTVPSNIELVYARGSSLSIAAGCTVTVNTVWNNTLYGADVRASTNVYAVEFIENGTALSNKYAGIGASGLSTNGFTIVGPMTGTVFVGSIALVGDSNAVYGVTDGLAAGLANYLYGNYSAVLAGLNNVASNTYAAVLAGQGNVSRGTMSAVGSGYKATASGQGVFVAAGNTASASGPYSFAQGNATSASGTNSAAFGNSTAASGPDSFSANWQNTVAARAAAAFGWSSSATGIYSFVKGRSCTAGGASSSAEGLSSATHGEASHAEGYETVASGQASHSEGMQTHASGHCSHSEGNATTASGLDSHAEGFSTEASGSYSHSEGYDTTASGESSHAQGRTSTASGFGAFAAGTECTASASNSIALGYKPYAIHPNTFMWSDGTETNRITTTSNAFFVSALNGFFVNGQKIVDSAGNVCREPTNMASKTGFTMTGPLVAGGGINMIGQSLTDVLSIDIATQGVAIGRSANAYDYGTAVGYWAKAQNSGSAVGYLAIASNYGAAFGRMSQGWQSGAAVGDYVQGNNYGAALGRLANGQFYGVAIGAYANGCMTNIAVGYRSEASGGNSISLGRYVTNKISESASIRGTLYLDGGSNIYIRSTFGSGAWVPYVTDDGSRFTNLTWNGAIVTNVDPLTVTPPSKWHGYELQDVGSTQRIIRAFGATTNDWVTIYP